MMLEEDEPDRELYNTYFFFLFFLLHLSTVSASSYFGLSFSFLPPCRLGTGASLLSHLSPFPPSHLSLLIYPCLAPLLSCSSPLAWMDWQLLFPSLSFGGLLLSYWQRRLQFQCAICTIIWNPTFQTDLIALQCCSLSLLTIDGWSVQWRVHLSHNSV